MGKDQGSSRLERRLWLAPALGVGALYGWWALRPDARFFMEDAEVVARFQVGGWSSILRDLLEPLSTGATAFCYRPLGQVALGVLARAFGPRPVVFRLFNLGLAGGSAGLLARLLRREGLAPAAVGLWVLALLLHPAVPNLIYWAVGCFDLGAALCLLGALLLAMAERRSWAAAALVVTAWLGALLCKESAAPALLGLVVAAANAGGRRWAARVASLGAVLGGAWLALYEHFATGAEGARWSAQVPIAFAQYFAWLPLFPPGTGAVYHIFDPDRWSLTLAGVGLMALLATLAVILVSRPTLAPGGRALAAGLVSAAAMLVPVALLVPDLLAQPVRYLLLPLTLALPMLAIAAHRIAPALAPGLRRIAQGSALGILAWWAIYSLPRPADWVRPLDLWLADYERDPSYYAAAIAGFEVLTEGGPPEAKRDALRLLDEAEAEVPKDGSPTLLHPCALYSWRADGLYCTGQVEAAEALATRALEHCAQNDDSRFPGLACLASMGGPDQQALCADTAPLCP